MKKTLILSALFAGSFIGQQVQVFPQQQVGLTARQKAVLDVLSIQQTANCHGGEPYKTLVVSGANLQIVNGTGYTGSTNGLGNLIVGYNEDITGSCINEGSHNIIAGFDNNYRGYSNIVFGQNNTADSNLCSVLGGLDHAINFGSYSVIVGGSANSINDSASVVVGGDSNSVNAGSSVVVGGASNVNSGFSSVIVGGQSNNITGGLWQVITGGQDNFIFQGIANVVSGGLSRWPVGDGLGDWTAGTLAEEQ